MRRLDQSFARALLKWYDAHRRQLPWRASRGRLPNPYHVLVSEAMLQQTQVTTVLPYYRRFTQRFHSLAKLADAPLHDVLCMWQGLGYYARARNLRAAAKIIQRDFGGRVPRDVATLRTLPGIGRYTAGAIASLAFDQPAAILDGNVARVLCRLDRILSSPKNAGTRERLWRRAETILPRNRAGDFNSALMDLGATVCLPRSPDCPNCPVRSHCAAFATRDQDRIPRRAKSKATPLVQRRTLCIRRVCQGGEHWLIEQRPHTGRWAGLWQFVTRPINGPIQSKKVGTIRHALTHRQYEFDVRLIDANQLTKMNNVLDPARATAWATLDQLSNYPLPRPQQRVAELLRDR
jgi:A/G-specific adenine glycosylase